MTGSIMRRTGTGAHPARGVLLAACALASVTFACATAPLTLPAGPGTPAASAAAILQEARSGCRDVRTLTAELRISGKAGRDRLGGRILAGLAIDGSIRLEGIAPFGGPVFVLAGRDDRATLVLTRERRALTDAAPASILEALTGVGLEPADLLAAIAGCGISVSEPGEASAHPGNWLTIDVGRDKTLFLQRWSGRWRVRAARRGTVTVEYAEPGPDRWRRVRLRVDGPAGTVADLRLSVSAVEVNVDLPDAAFRVDVPSGSSLLTLDELRESGPLARPLRQ